MFRTLIKPSQRRDAPVDPYAAPPTHAAVRRTTAIVTPVAPTASKPAPAAIPSPREPFQMPPPTADHDGPRQGAEEQAQPRYVYDRPTQPSPTVRQSAPPPPVAPPAAPTRLTLWLAQIQARLLAWVEMLNQLEHALLTPLFRRPLLTIVSQADLTQKQIDGLNAYVPTTIRLGLLGAIGLVMWWTWPSPQLPPTIAAQLQRAGTQSTNALSALAIINSTALGDDPQAVGSLILRPTPTPTTAESVALAEPAAALDDGRTDTAAASLILVPTITAVNVIMPPIVTVVPQVRVLPGVELKRSLTPEPPTPTPTPSPTPIPVNLNPGRLWSTFAPAAAPDNDHYWVGRPFGSYATNQLASPSYQFGSTAGDRYRTHHGVDISNPQGTPVLSATDGVVVHAGLDDTVLLGPYNNFYGNAVVIRLNRQLPVANGQLDVFLLYGHLSQVNVTVGQQVRPEDVIGAVGMTGIAIGPHLHVEIRLGSNTYYNNVNPYLWLTPLEGQGSVAVRVLTADGRTWPGAAISLVRFSSGVAAWARQIITYGDVENIGPDPAWGENGAMDGMPAGSYYVVGVVNGERVSAEITVRAGETTFVELRTSQ
ncbi:MAG: M23 family metallopeptidase [Caldilineaceae bacterium]|nr:M23 family metallopeptidase [Caldilineaceae bacterium]